MPGLGLNDSPLSFPSPWSSLLFKNKNNNKNDPLAGERCPPFAGFHGLAERGGEFSGS